MTSYNLKGVEIFSAGTWNGDKYTVDDLHGIVEAFNETKGGVQPYLKLGHAMESPRPDGSTEYMLLAIALRQIFQKCRKPSTT
jgi:hypothetical protein